MGISDVSLVISIISFCFDFAADGLVFSTQEPPAWARAAPAANPSGPPSGRFSTLLLKNRKRACLYGEYTEYVVQGAAMLDESSRKSTDHGVP